MRNTVIYDEAARLTEKFGTRDPFALLDALGVRVLMSGAYRAEGLKGYCYMANRSTFAVINDRLRDEEKRIVAMHELGHIVLHGDILRLAPMQDFDLYGMKLKTEYEANLFAGDALIADSEVETLAADEDKDYFSMCATLGVPPQLMSFKLYSMTGRGYNYRLPQNIDSGFLKARR